MSDRIFIRGLAMHAYHGVIAHEVKVGQTFTLDIDLGDAARSDKVTDTVSTRKSQIAPMAPLIRNTSG